MGRAAGSKIRRPDAIDWPIDMGAMPTKLMVHALSQVAMTFPVGTVLGWERIHPRAMCRLNEHTLEWLAAVIYHCDVTGEWPVAVDRVIIAYYPKRMGELDRSAACRSVPPRRG